MQTTKPVIVLLHGAWHLPQAWDPIVPLLEDAGYTVARPHLPSSGADPPLPDMSADIAVIRATVLNILDARNRNALVVMHSYSGLPGTSALYNLDRNSRQTDGKPTYVIRLVYINSYLVPTGTQLNPVGTRDNMIPHMVTDFDKGVVTADPSMSREMMFQDVTDEQLEQLNSVLVPHSIGVFWDRTSFDAWRFVPTTYVRCLRDMPNTVAIIGGMIDAAREAGGMVDRVIDVDCGHVPYVTRPGWTARTLRREAGEFLEGVDDE